MTVEEQMQAWLESTDPNKRKHAQERIALGFTKRPPSPLRRAASVAKARADRLRHADTTCLYADPSPGACLPIRCWAGRGVSCGGKHTDTVHCQHCLYPDPTQLPERAGARGPS